MNRAHIISCPNWTSGEGKGGIINNYARNTSINQDIWFPQLSVGSYTQRNVSQRMPVAEIGARILGKDLRVKPKVEITKAVVLNQGRFWSPGNIRRYLKTFSVVTIQGYVANTSRWVKTRDARRHPTKHRTAPHNKVGQPTPARVPRLRIPVLKILRSAGTNI